MNNVLENKESINKRCCPSCGSVIREVCHEETCKLLTGTTDILSVCVKAHAFTAYQEAVIRADELSQEDVGMEDPCIHCSHNIVIMNSGTFVRMEGEVGAFVEIHKCDCGTEFQVTA